MNESNKQLLDRAAEHFRALAQEQLERSERIKNNGDFKDYSKLDRITIGFCG